MRRGISPLGSAGNEAVRYQPEAPARASSSLALRADPDRLGNRRLFLLAVPSILHPGQFVRKLVGVVNLAESFDDALGMDGQGPGLLLGVNEIEHQRLKVAVED